MKIDTQIIGGVIILTTYYSIVDTNSLRIAIKNYIHISYVLMLTYFKKWQS